jgi:hypothetical protein
MQPTATPADNPHIDMSRSVEEQDSILALRADLDALQPEMEAAKQAIHEATLAKKQFYDRASQGGYASLAETADEDILLSLNIPIESALNRLKAVQAKERELQHALDTERRRITGAMAELLLTQTGPVFLAMAELLESVDIRERALAELIGTMNGLFPLSQRPFKPDLLTGTPAQKARKLRSVAQR